MARLEVRGGADADAPIPVHGAARTWVAGVEVELGASEWAERQAGFLGCGFRLLVPDGPERSAALDRAHAVALEVAGRVGATLDEVPWAVAPSLPAPLLLTGGWTHRFRAPLGECHTRLTPYAVAAARCTAPGRTLPWQVNEHSPTTGLPMVSAHHEARAEAWLSAGTVGLWRNTAGLLVDTTAGPPLLLTEAGWQHPSPGQGTVPHHLWERAGRVLGAGAWRGEDDAVRAALCLGAEGSLTLLATLDGRELAGEDAAEVVRAYAALAPLLPDAARDSVG